MRPAIILVKILILISLASCNQEEMSDAATVSGQVLLDTDWDDIADQGLAGVTVALESDGLAVGSAMTDADGGYAISNIPSGTYRIVATLDQPALQSMLPVYAADELPDGDPGEEVRLLRGMIAVRVEGEEVDDGNTFVYRVNDRASITGVVGKNLSGGTEVETPLAAVELSLYDAGGQLLSTQKSDTDGCYTFYGLLAGDYVLRISPLTDIEQDLVHVIDRDLTPDGDVGDADSKADGMIAVTVSEMEADDGNTFVLRTNPCANDELATHMLGSWGSGSYCVTFREDGILLDPDHRFPIIVNGMLLTNKRYSITDEDELQVVATDDNEVISSTVSYQVTYYDCSTVEGDFSEFETWTLVRK